MKTLSIIVALTSVIICESANILSFTTFPGHSHYVMLKPLITELANRGHNITAITYFPQKTPVENIHDIDVSSIHPVLTNSVPIDHAITHWRPTINIIDFIFTFSRENCKSVFEQQKVQELLKNENNIKYDLIITELFGSDCFLAFAHKFNASIVSVATTVGFPWIHNLIGNPDNPSYVPTYFLHASSVRTFYQRLTNTFINVIANIGYEFFSNYPTQTLVEEYFGEIPTLREIRKNTSLILANSHYSFRHIQPTIPNYVEVAGIHLRKPEPLPKDIQEILDKSTNGAILVSLGSVVQFATMPKDKLNAFLVTFEKLPYQIIWKIENNLPNLPPNIYSKKWLPIQDILDHPNIKLMVMHGGMSTTIETVNAGVPIVGIPVFAEQIGNVESLESKGVGVLLDYNDINQESLYDAINKVATDPSYRENMKKVSAAFKDRQSTPLETAVYWIEYVLRHKGALHLQSPAVHLSWYQLMLLDVIFVFIAIILVIVFILYLIVRTARNLLRKPTKKKKKQS